MWTWSHSLGGIRGLIPCDTELIPKLSSFQGHSRKDQHFPDQARPGQDLDEKMWIGHKFVGASMVGRVTGSVIDASPWICLSKALENERPVILDSKSFILLSHVSCLEVKLVCVHV